MSISEVAGLQLKPEKKGIMQVRSSLNLVERHGIDGDFNAGERRPRQVLLAEEETLQEFGLNHGDLRENIVTRDFDLNNIPSGTVLRIGDTARVRITFTCEVCSYIGTLSIDRPASIIGKRGMLGVILQGGEIRPGDEISDEGVLFPEVPSNFSNRFKWVVSQIPEGNVATYASLLDTIGCSSAYMRSFPGQIRKYKDEVPVHRILNTDGLLIEHVPKQLDYLEAEGIQVINSGVDLKRFLWDSSDLYYEEL